MAHAPLLVAVPVMHGCHRERSLGTHSGVLSATALVAVSWLAAGCTGEIIGQPGTDAAAPGGGPGADSQGATPVVDAAWPVSFTGRASALRRLSRDELVTTMRSLTGQAPDRGELPEEQRSGHHPLRTTGMAFISSEVSKLLPVVKAFAADAAPALLQQSACVQQGQAQRDCLATFGMSLAERALRRAAAAGEAQSFAALVAIADGTPEADRAAMEGVLTTIFFAPSFLYRTEIGAPVAGEPAKRLLTGRELATKLSYFATLAPPDAELLGAASAGKLGDGAERIKHLDRLLQSPSGKQALNVFVMEWLGANESKVGQKSARYQEGLSPSFAGDIRASADAFIAAVLGGPEPTVSNLLTGSGYVSDPAVRQIAEPSAATGVATGDQAAFERVGLLMHPHVIASHTKENGASPFQLGYFLKEVLLCETVAPPPANATAMAKDDAPAGLSLRETLEYSTSVSPVCSGCHVQFAPLGFSFLALDPLGRWVVEDPSGKPWDLSGSVATASGEPLVFDGPAEMLRSAAARPQVQGCFAQIALEWSLGRGLVDADAPMVAALDAQIGRSGGDVPAILRAIVGTPEFADAVSPQ